MSDTIVGIDRDELGRVIYKVVADCFPAIDWSDLRPNSRVPYYLAAEAVALHIEAAVRAEKAVPSPPGITLDELRAAWARIQAKALRPQISNREKGIRFGQSLMLSQLIAQAEAKAAPTPGVDTTDDATPCGDGPA